LTPKQLANAIINKKIDIMQDNSIKAFITTNQTVDIDDAQLQTTILEAMKENQKAVEDYKKGKETVLMFLLGQVLRKLAVKADAQMIKERLIEELKK
jgi:aspartyl-tRNA(Asn)/glutamyl-tRNA(Gln) amidotransferase subunit B